MKTLIVYDTYTGTTEKCAKIIAEKLQNADLVNISEQRLPSLESYDCIVIGSYVHAGHISKKIKRFMSMNFQKIKDKKVGIYLCMLGEQKHFDQYINSNFDRELLSIVRVKDFFGGELNYQRMNFLFRFILRQIEKRAKPQLGIRTQKILDFAEKLMNQT